MHGSAYLLRRNPSLNARTDPTLVVTPGTTCRSAGTDLKMFGGTFGGPIMKNKIFSFTSFEQWNDNPPAARSSARCRPSWSATATSASRC